MKRYAVRAAVIAATLAVGTGVATLDANLAGCTGQGGLLTGYCAPSANQPPIVWWDLGTDSIDVGTPHAELYVELWEPTITEGRKLASPPQRSGVITFTV